MLLIYMYMYVIIYSQCIAVYYLSLIHLHDQFLVIYLHVYLTNVWLFIVSACSCYPIIKLFFLSLYVIKFVSNLRQIGGFPRVLRFSPPIKLTATI